MISLQVRIPRRDSKKKSKTGAPDPVRFCFLEFPDADAASKALTALAHKPFRGGRAHVDRLGADAAKKPAKDTAAAPKKTTSIHATRLFVSGLPPGMDYKSLKKLFPKCHRADIPRGKKRGFGFVDFRSPGEALSAFEASKEMKAGGRTLTVVFAKRSKDNHKSKERAEKRQASAEENGDSKPPKAKKAKKKERSAAKKKAKDVENDADSDDEENEIKEENESGSEEEVENDADSDDEDEAEVKAEEDDSDSAEVKEGSEDEDDEIEVKEEGEDSGEEEEDSDDDDVENDVSDDE